MAKIQIKRGEKSSLQNLSLGEPYLATDTDELFIGGDDGNLQIPIMGDDATLLATGLNDSSGVYLTESVYNFRFLIFQIDSGKSILIPIIQNQTVIYGSATFPSTESYDTYLISAGIIQNGTIIGDNHNSRITLILGNPAYTAYSAYTVTNIYGICRISS